MFQFIAVIHGQIHTDFNLTSDHDERDLEKISEF